MQINDALTLVRELRERVEQSDHYCCYRATTVAVSGFMAIAAGIAQSIWLSNPQANLGSYLQLWITVATVSVTVIGTEVWWRWHSTSSALRRQQTLVAISQFVPCLVAGVLITIVIYDQANEYAPMLPGLWSILFSMGICSSLRQLPASAIYVAGYYLLSGTLALSYARDEQALAPWAMIFTFGIGQLLSALVLRNRGNYVTS